MKLKNLPGYIRRGIRKSFNNKLSMNMTVDDLISKAVKERRRLSFKVAKYGRAGWYGYLVDMLYKEREKYNKGEK